MLLQHIHYKNIKLICRNFLHKHYVNLIVNILVMNRFILLLTLFSILGTSLLFGNSKTNNSKNNYDCELSYTVSLPMKDDDIKYSAKIWSIEMPNDTLAGCNYLIEYKHQMDTMSSFTSYFDRNYYKFENEKLQEYHWDWDSIPFKGTGKIMGIQKTGLFAPFMPTEIMHKMSVLEKDPNNKLKLYSDTLINGIKVNAVKLKEIIKGNVAKDIFYYADVATGRPLYYESMNNPGSIGEQLVTIRYNYNAELTPIKVYNEEMLRDRYPIAFSRFRESNFSIENLPGRKLPMFSLPSTTSERYTWDGGFKNNAIIVFLEVGNGLNKDLIAAVRDAVKNSVVPLDVLWIYNNKNIDAITEEMPDTREDEFALIGGKSFATDCGVTGFPTLIFVDKKGIVKDVQLGFNKDMKNVVIQKIALMNN